MLGFSFVPTRELDDLRRRVGITDEIERTAAYLDIIKAMTATLAERPACGCAARPTPTPPTPAAPALSAAVLVACRQYSGGDKREEVANQKVALALQAQGKQEREIVAAIMRGAHGIIPIGPMGGSAQPASRSASLTSAALDLAADPDESDDPDEHTFRIRAAGPPRGRAGDEMAVTA